MRLLLELRPALDGHAGIPQETRLLFRGLSLLPALQVEGLIQSSNRRLSKGLPSSQTFPLGKLSRDREINRLSRVVVSMEDTLKKTTREQIGDYVGDVLSGAGLASCALLGRSQQLTRFESDYFRDFIWRRLFAKTLPYEDFELVTKAHFRVATVPWTTMQVVALIFKNFGHALYPRISTGEFDAMIAQTPYPGIVTGKTKLIVRYHDAIPLLMPHTISDKAFHQASHYHALRNNVLHGAHFACVSDATRKDLISIFPDAEPKSVTIHNMVSHHYFAENSPPLRIGEIIRTRLHSAPAAGSKSQFASIDRATRHQANGAIPYLLIVSTIEPRKNHLSLLSAWEKLRVEKFPELKLVTVGMLGWDHEKITRKFRPWQDRGELFMLEDVPSPELRLLYKHARATVCPSFGEGFDFSGVEAMRCGGVVAASDIPVHREIYGQAAQYFSPYAIGEIADAIAALIDPKNENKRGDMIRAGATVSGAYVPDKILPKWRDFLSQFEYSAVKQPEALTANQKLS